MQPTDILAQEHRIIEQVLCCLEKLVERSLQARRLDGLAAREAVDFFRFFADRCHHGKEEKHLFPMLEAKGLPRHGGPTGVMLYEHEAGRAHVRGMDESIEAASRGNLDALQQFVSHARDYIQLLRAHIHKEDHCLFAMANQVLSDADQRSLMESFELVESEHAGEATHEKYIAIANDLADRFGVPRAQIETEEGATRWACSHV